MSSVRAGVSVSGAGRAGGQGRGTARQRGWQRGGRGNSSTFNGAKSHVCRLPRSSPVKVAEAPPTPPTPSQTLSPLPVPPNVSADWEKAAVRRGGGGDVGGGRIEICQGSILMS